MSLAERVVSRYFATVQKTAQIVLVEKGDMLEVSGGYNEMQKVIPRLKALGFRYDGARRIWSTLVTGLTSQKRKNLENLIVEANGNGNGKGPQSAPVDPEKAQLARKEHAALINWKWLRGGSLPVTGSVLVQAGYNSPSSFFRSSGGAHPASSAFFSHDCKPFERLSGKKKRFAESKHERAIRPNGTYASSR
jgi:hypothetical protein